MWPFKSLPDRIATELDTVVERFNQLEAIITGDFSELLGRAALKDLPAPSNFVSVPFSKARPRLTV
jgi:hypothetical protein